MRCGRPGGAARLYSSEATAAARARRRRARSARAPRRSARRTGPARSARRSRGRCCPAARRRPARAVKSPLPRPCFSDFSPLWPASPPPVRDLDLPERQVDLVVDHDHVVEVHAERAARRADRVARLVHVGLRQQHATAGRRVGAPLCKGRRTSSWTSAAPALGERASPPRSRRCGGCGRSGRPGSRARRPASQPCLPPRRKRLTRSLRPPRQAAPRPRPAPRHPPRPRRLGALLERLAVLADQLGLLLDLRLLDLGRDDDRRDDRLLRVVEERRRPRAR